MDFRKNFFSTVFFQKKKKTIEEDLNKLSHLDSSIVFFISPNKINKIIPILKKNFGGRKILICREMTKYFEEFVRTEIDNIIKFDFTLKGELTIVLSELIKKKNLKEEITESVRIEIKKMLKKYSHKDVVEFISKKENLPKKIIYNYCLKFK